MLSCDSVLKMLIVIVAVPVGIASHTRVVRQILRESPTIVTFKVEVAPKVNV